MKKLAINLLIFTGLPGSGKGEAALVAKGMGYNTFSIGDLIREETKKRYQKITQENDRKVSLWFNDGREFDLIKRLKRKIQNTKTNKSFCILEGLRVPDHCLMLKKVGINFRVVNIISPKKVRYSRQLSRHRQDIRTNDDAIYRDRRELGYGIGKILEDADERISNNGTKSDFRKKIEKFIRKIEEKNLFKSQRQ
ncbi:MAG: AAA family ATPase [Candidatus Aenigmatarchaeota archaeon]